MSAKEMFEKLGFDYFYWKDEKSNTEDTIHYTKKNKFKIQFNIESKIFAIIDLSDSEQYYICPTIFINQELLQAINKQVEELGWK